MKTRFRVIMMTAVCGLAGLLHAQTYTNMLGGNWDASGSWSATPGIPPAGGGTNVTVYFNNGAAVVSDNNRSGAFVLNNLTFSRGNAVTLSGNEFVFTNSGATLPQVSQNAGTPVNSIANNSMLATNTTFYVNNGSLTNAGVISGPGQLIKTGAATVLLAASNTYSGATTVSAGTLTINGANGAISSPSVMLNGGKLNLDNTGAGNNNNGRVPDTTAITLSGGGELALVGNGATLSTTESVGTLTHDAGTAPIITVSGTGSGTLHVLTAAGLSRASKGMALVRGTSLGQAASNAGRLMLTDTSGLTFVGATTANDATPGNAKDVKIVPYLVGDLSATGTGSGVVTYDTTGGLRPLASTEYNTLTAGYTTAASHENVKGAAVTLENSVVVNSLTFASAVTLNGSTTTLGIDSGAIVASSAATFGNTISSITLGNDGTWNEGTIYNTANLTFNAPLNVTGSGGLTKAGSGTLILARDNHYTGVTTVNAGTLQIGNGGTLGAIAGGLTLGRGTTLAYNRTDASAPIAGVITPNGGNITISSGHLMLNTGNLPANSLNTFGTLNIANGTELTLGGASAATNEFAGMASWARNFKMHITGGATRMAGDARPNGKNAIYALGGVLNISGVIFPYANNAGDYSYLLAHGGTLNLGAAANLARGAMGMLEVRNGGVVTFTAGGGGVGLLMREGNGGAYIYQSGGTVQGAGILILGNGAGSRAEITIQDGLFEVVNNNLQVDNSVVAIINLNGGVASVNQLTRNGTISDATVNFNGGTLKSRKTESNFFNVGTFNNAYIFTNGATIDVGTYNNTISMPLRSPTGLGVTVLPWSGTLTGYIGAPYVEIRGGTGKNATGAALFDYDTMSVTNVIVTSSGTDYQNSDTVTVTLKGGGQPDVNLGNATIGEISSGGLTKLGSGTLTLSGTNTFTGATMVSAGTLKLSHTNALPAVMDVYINSASGAKVDLSAGKHVIRKLFVDNMLQPKELLGAVKLPNSITGTGFFYPTEGKAGTLIRVL